MIDRDIAVLEMLRVADFVRNEFPGYFFLVELVGSCAIQGKGNDIDVLVHANERGTADDVGALLLLNGWSEQAGKEDEYGQGEFRSFRQADTNLLLVWDSATYTSWLAAVEVCKYIGTTTREQRVAIHQIVMDGEIAVNLAPYSL